jgi:hypothetical protein
VSGFTGKELQAYINDIKVGNLEAVSWAISTEYVKHYRHVFGPNEVVRGFVQHNFEPEVGEALFIANLRSTDRGALICKLVDLLGLKDDGSEVSIQVQVGK